MYSAEKHFHNIAMQEDSGTKINYVVWTMLCGITFII
jgi:hypothetical protein